MLARASAGPRSIARVNDTRLTWSRRKHTAAIEDLRLNTYTTARTLEFRSQSKHAWISSLRRPFDGNRHSPFTPESTPQHFKQPDILRRITSLDGTHKKNKEGTTEEAAIKSEMDICFPSSIFWRREWERRSPRRHVEENDIKDKLRQTAGKASKIPRHYISQKHRRCFQTTWEKEKGDQQVQSASLKTFGLGKMARRWAAKLGVAPAVQYAWANKGNTHTHTRASTTIIIKIKAPATRLFKRTALYDPTHPQNISPKVGGFKSFQSYHQHETGATVIITSSTPSRPKRITSGARTQVFD